MTIVPQGAFPVSAAVGGIYGAYNVVNTIVTSAERASAAAEVVVRAANQAGPAIQAITNAGEQAMEIVSEIVQRTPRIPEGKRLRTQPTGPSPVLRRRPARGTPGAYSSRFKRSRRVRKTRRLRRRR